MVWWRRSSSCQSGSLAVQRRDLSRALAREPELVGAPGEQENVLSGAQPQQRAVHRGRAEHDQALAGTLDLAAEGLLNLLGGDRLQPRDHQGVTGRRLAVALRHCGKVLSPLSP